MRVSIGCGIVAACLAVSLTTSGAGAAEPSFGSYWHDGKAELDGYRLTVQRYGHARHGRAVAIYVTEPFSRSKHVKLDDPSKAPGDAVDVLKLNLARDFQTGIYDYHTIVSLFVASADFAPLKIAFSSSVFRSGEFANCSLVLFAACWRRVSDSNSLPLITLFT